MGYRELLFVVLSLILYSSLSSTVSSFFMLSSEDILQDELKYEAVTLGQRIIEEVKTKEYDANTTSGPFPQSFENPFSMTHGSGETYPNFNDIDDYCNGYNSGTYEPFEIQLATKRANFTIETKVSYVDENDLDTSVMTQKFFKKLDVTIKCDRLNNEIKLSHVFGFIKPL
jgi:hypothetical protein